MKRLSIGNKLYISVLSVFLAFAVAFIIFQHEREKQYKAEILDLRLQDYNDQMKVSLDFLGKTDETTLGEYVRRHHVHNLRVFRQYAKGLREYSQSFKQNGVRKGAEEWTRYDDGA